VVSLFAAIQRFHVDLRIVQLFDACSVIGSFINNFYVDELSAGTSMSGINDVASILHASAQFGFRFSVLNKFLIEIEFACIRN